MRDEPLKQFFHLLHHGVDRRPLLGIQSAPGCGKTTFINFIMKNIHKTKDPHFVSGNFITTSHFQIPAIGLLIYFLLLFLLVEKLVGLQVIQMNLKLELQFVFS